ncbi:MAG: hypothetical protein EBR72_06585 [Bacteroidetes bacterium]|nr:hypothetical protein [Bacteroidota bacterium]
MTDQNNQNTDEKVSQEREDAVVALANEFLGRATLAEALSQVSLNAVLQLVQNQALTQGREQVKDMTDEQVSELLAAVEKSKTENAANEAVEQVSEETAAAS